MPASYFKVIRNRDESQLFQSNLIFTFTVTDVAAEVIMLLKIRGVGANKTLPQNGLQASVCALAESSNNTGHVLHILPQVLNNLCPVFPKIETKEYLRVVEDIEKCPSPGALATHSACPSHGLNQVSITMLQYGKFCDEGEIYSGAFRMNLDNRMLFVGRPHKDDLLHIRNINSEKHPAQVFYNHVKGTDWRTCWW